ncbi:MAG: hypothetical protein Q8R18_01175 [bacterium]|nr:hypothetical protein [bacterium]
MDIVEFYQQALQDPEIAMIFLSSKHKRKLEILLKEHPEEFFLSEWEYQLGGIEFKYHIHEPKKGQEIKRLYDAGESAGNPNLFRVYSRRDLEEKLESYRTKPSRDNEEIHY